MLTSGRPVPKGAVIGESPFYRASPNDLERGARQHYDETGPDEFRKWTPAPVPRGGCTGMTMGGFYGTKIDV